MYVDRVYLQNKAPFDCLDLSFIENEIVVLSALNGKGKTTIISHIVDALIEMTKKFYNNEYEDKQNKYYRISSSIHSIDFEKPSFAYIRFVHHGNVIDFLDIRGSITMEEYDRSIPISNKIPFHEISKDITRRSSVKYVSKKLDEKLAMEIFDKTINTYFPSYRYETPGFLNDLYKVKSKFKCESRYNGYMMNPIEVISGLPDIINWLIDVMMDHQYLNIGTDELSKMIEKKKLDGFINISDVPDFFERIKNYCIEENSSTEKAINCVFSELLSSKGHKNVRIGVGNRNFGSTRLQLVDADTNQSIYPTLYNISSGEAAIICIFVDLIRQKDNILCLSTKK